jgi:eukaryotic-like serine/threonine-protein kinase
MENGRAAELHPAALPMGTQVGPWRVVGWAGRGTYGAVYRAVRVGQEKRGSVALKLAVHPQSPRFAREVALLSRLRHPNVPELKGHGEWKQAGRAYPFLVMEWVEGVPLYEWASARNPTSRQVLKVLAQVARALAALHSLQALHRDVKGDNVRVRLEDGRVFLMDLGLASYSGASPLTSEPLPPGTTLYRSPEAWRFAYEHRRKPGAHYDAQPADDVFALGVAAWRLVTDEYPPSTNPEEDKAGLWREDGAGPRPPLELNPRLNPWLSVLILKMLSVRPERRGRALELARMLEQEAEQADSESDLPVFAWESLPQAAWPPAEAVAALELGHRPRHRIRGEVHAAEERDFKAKAEAVRLEAEAIARALARRGGAWPRWRECLAWLPLFLTATASLGALCLLVRWAASWEPMELPELAQAEARDGGVAEEHGTRGLSEEALHTRVVRAELPPKDGGVALSLPEKPLPGQRRPDSSGKCRHHREVPIHGGCWKLTYGGGVPPCEANEYEWQGGCYVPAWESSREPTSDQP